MFMGEFFSIAKTKSEGRYLVRLSLKLNVFNVTVLLIKGAGHSHDETE
jgi:hypothetical protein